MWRNGARTFLVGVGSRTLQRARGASAFREGKSFITDGSEKSRPVALGSMQVDSVPLSAKMTRMSCVSLLAICVLFAVYALFAIYALFAVCALVVVGCAEWY